MLSFWKRSVPLFFAGIPLLVSLMVLVGWYIKNIALIRVLPHFTGMQYNTALCIFLLSAAIILFLFEKSWIPRALCLFVAVLTFFTAIQDIAQTDFGIDNFFFTYNLETTMNHPGRMALNTAFCLFFLGLIIITLSFNTEIFDLIALILSAIVLSFAIVSFLSYLTGLESLAGWKNFSRMAVHTAFCVIFLSFSIGLHIVIKSLTSSTQLITLPLTAAMLALTSSVAVWQAFKAQEFFFAEKEARDVLEYLKADMEDSLREEIGILRRLAERWEILEGYPEALWQKDTQNYLNDLKGLAFISVVDKNFQILKQAGKADNVLSQLYEEEKTLQALQKKETTIKLDKTTKKLLVFIPLFFQSSFKGALISELDPKVFFEKSLRSLGKSHYLILLLSKNTILFSSGEDLPVVVGSPLSVNFSYIPWVLEIYITKDSLKGGFWQLTFFLILGGLLITTLSFAATYLAVSIRMKKKAIEKQNQELASAKQKAEEATVAKSTFLATMSHEIRTPLNAIIGTIQLVTETNLDEIQKKYVKRINLSSRSLLNLLNDILDFSKMESGTLKIEKAPCNLLDIARQSSQDLLFKAKEKGLDLLLDFPSFSMPDIETDPYRLQQIITNFINNSLKFTEKGSITTRISYKEKENKQLLTKIEVIDSGIGISPENLQKLFQKFSQVEVSHARKSGGVGLGLSICKHLVEAMQGSVGVESEPGKGSCFWAEIPFYLASNQPPSSNYSLEGKKIELQSSCAKEQDILSRYLRDWKVFLTTEADKNLSIFSSDLKEKIEEAKKGKKTIALIKNEEGQEEGIAACFIRPIGVKDFFSSLQKILNP